MGDEIPMYPYEEDEPIVCRQCTPRLAESPGSQSSKRSTGVKNENRCRSRHAKLRCEYLSGHSGMHGAPAKPSSVGYVSWGEAESWGGDSAPFVPGSAASHAAARKIAPALKQLRIRVHAYIKSHPGLTDRELTLRLKLKTARSRRIELERKGLVVWTGKTKAGKRSLGASAQTWQVTKVPYPKDWAELPQVKKTRTGEARVRRALARAFPLRSKSMAKLVEKIVADVAAKKDPRKRIYALRPMVTRAMFVRLMLYVLR